MSLSSFVPVVPLDKPFIEVDLSREYSPDRISLDPPSLGGYNEKRKNMYVSALYADQRDVHVGLDFWMPVQTPVFIGSDAKLIHLQNNNRDGDYGPVMVFQHPLPDVQELLAGYLTRWMGTVAAYSGKTTSRKALADFLKENAKSLEPYFDRDELASFLEVLGEGLAIYVTSPETLFQELKPVLPDTLYSLYGHLSEASLTGKKPGMMFRKGEQVAEMGAESENGGWIPHLHLQLSMLRPSSGDLPGVVHERTRALALALFPDPGFFLPECTFV
ncbi:hypothetical protein QLX67_12270 [Balneolaceae bacterium ANBcel3]|nr:hypothetical protein [Balneolaceae bacterium ANBcel3]